MTSSSPGVSVTESRSLQVVARGLRQAVARTHASLTLQEGLYRAYLTDLCDLPYFDDVPTALETELQSVLAELRGVFGLDEATGTKVTASTLDRQRASEILMRLEAIASAAEALAQRLEAQ
jgi:hypothetical protein